MAPDPSSIMALKTHIEQAISCLDTVMQESGTIAGREIALVKTKLQEASMWTQEAHKKIGVSYIKELEGVNVTSPSLSKEQAQQVGNAVVDSLKSKINESQNIV